MSDTSERLRVRLADRYRIERELGAGGMATVYLAHDLKHERDVAIKVLHPDLGAALGGERFLSEIRTTARLQHPHILPLLDSGEADGLLYYVMPLVTGETLRARLEREKLLPIDDSVLIAREVADALGYAHSLGVIHRDIKPENILLQGGHALVADFGIALAVQSAGGSRMTQTGLSLGTPQYMSPEQAMGERTIDARSDIYALGAVLYEMLTGDPPFTGSTVQAIVAKVLTERPTAPRAVRDTVPAHVERAVLTALAKLPADRFASARAFIDAMERATSEPDRAASGAGRARPPWILRTAVAACALLFLALVVSSVGWWRTSRRAANLDPVQFGLAMPEGVHVANGMMPFALAPDGRTVAIVGEGADGRNQLFVRAIGSPVAVPVPGTDGAIEPTFSPDGAWIVFVSGSQLRKVRTSGGEVTTLAEVGDPQGLSWGAAGLIFVANDGRLGVVPENGGSFRPLAGGTTPSGNSERFPIALPGDKSLLYTEWSGTLVAARVMRRTIESAPATTVGVDSAMAIGIVQGWLVTGGSGGILSMAPFDGARATGPSRQVFQGVALVLSLTSATVAPNGTLLYQPGTGLSDLVLRGPGGDTTVAAERRDYAEPRLSPDGTRIATVALGRNGADLWIIDRATGAGARLTSDGRRYGRPEWMPGGARLIYRALGDSLTEIYARRWDGSDAPLRLQANPRVALWEASVSPDGAWLLYRSGTLGTADIFYRRLTGDTTSHPFVATSGTDAEGRFSPDGRWVAYTTNESGISQVFVRPFPTGDARIAVSGGGAEQPVWSPDGRSLYYTVTQGGLLIRAHVALSPAFTVASRDTVLRGFDFVPRNGHATYDVAADGRLLLVRRTSVAPVVAIGWFDQARAGMTR